MAKFYGEVGYVEQQEVRTDVWKDKVTKLSYCGDIIKNNPWMETGLNVNDDVSLNNIISIVSDPYSREHMFAIRFVKWMGTYWKVTHVEIQSPRLLITIGGVYHGPTD